MLTQWRESQFVDVARELAAGASQWTGQMIPSLSGRWWIVTGSPDIAN